MFSVQYEEVSALLRPSASGESEEDLVYKSKIYMITSFSDFWQPHTTNWPILDLPCE
jgi:hypothetical protein